MDPHITGTQLEEETYWDGYNRGLKEASETWAAIIGEQCESRKLGWIGDRILELANRELGFRSIDSTAAEG